MLFPAPVSPVSTLKPAAKCTSSSSMMANARTRSSSSMAGKIADGSDNGGTLRAMFEPGDPRHDEILDSPTAQPQISCPTASAPAGASWCGSCWDHPVRRRHGRAAPGPARSGRAGGGLLAPEEMASLATSTVSAGGLSIRIAEVIPAGTQVDLSIRVPQRKVPLLVQAQVIWSRPESWRGLRRSVSERPRASRKPGGESAAGRRLRRGLSSPAVGAQRAMEAQTKAATPGPEHRALAKLKGKSTLQIHRVPSPASPAGC